MKQTIDFYLFCRAFETMNRDNNFSYEGKRALFDWLESLEDDRGEQMELDVIALCCEFCEYTLYDALSNFNCDDLDELCDKYTVIIVDDNNVIVGQ
jgi:hypothetical protein